MAHTKHKTISLAKDPVICKCEYRRQVGGTTEVGTPYGATKREGCAEMCGADACELHHWGLRWSSLWGHEA
eukprot:9470390-Pyramimonas_sp.AAC.2